MSDYIALEVQVDIMKRLPVKPLLRFRAVSKTWKSLIDSSEFSANYNVHQTQHHHLYVSFTIPKSSESKCVSILDDGSFPQHKLDLTIPMPIMQMHKAVLIGISQGLFCIADYEYSRMLTAYIWNPTNRKFVYVGLPYKLYLKKDIQFAFGVCSHTGDPKIVKITSMCDPEEPLPLSKILKPWQVEVFALSSGVWRNLSVNLPRQSCSLHGKQVVVNGFIYWVAVDTVDPRNIYKKWYYVILSFDLKREEFNVEYLPDSLAINHDITLSISKIKDSLVVLETNSKSENRVYGVWMMGRGSPNSFKKLFNISAPDASIADVLGFRNNGEAIIVVRNSFEEPDRLFVYEPYSKQIKYIGISGNICSLFASSYSETLLLLDH